MVENTEFGADSIKPEEFFSISTFLSGGLINYSQKLADLTSRANDRLESDCLATATVLTAAAAIEAILSEYQYLTKRSDYSRQFRLAGVSSKYKMITGRELDIDHPNVSALWTIRCALVHSEPDHERSRKYGRQINPDGAAWAYRTAFEFACDIWKSQMPEWLRSDLRMNSESDLISQGHPTEDAPLPVSPDAH